VPAALEKVNVGAAEGRTSFLKKRSKKPLIVLAAAFPDRASLDS
jgi:hypothetical protein